MTLDRRFPIWLLVCAVCMVLCTDGAFAAIQAEHGNPRGFQLVYRPCIITTDTLETPTGPSVRYDIDGHSTTSDKGWPDIPTETISFIAPQGIIPDISLAMSSLREVSPLRLAPVPELIPDAAGFPTPLYSEEPVRYALSGFQPERLVTLERGADQDDCTLWVLRFVPFRYNAASSIIAFADSIRVTVTFGIDLRVSKPAFIPFSAVNRDWFLPGGQSSQRRAAITAQPFASGDWYRITLSENGVYAITGAELAREGLGTGIPSTRLRLYYGGGRMLGEKVYTDSIDRFREMAITVSDGGDGVFDAEDRIIFFGEALSRFIPGGERPVYQNYLYADTGVNVYWLTIDSDGTPARISATGELPSADIPDRRSVRSFLHTEPENYLEWIDQFDAESGLQWYWNSINGKTTQLTFSAPGATETTNAEIRLGFRDGITIVEEQSSLRTYHYHKVYSTTDRGESFSTSINTRENETSAILLSLTQPLRTSNTLSISRDTPPNGQYEHIRLDWLEVAYDRTLDLAAGTLEFYLLGTGEPQRYTITNVQNASVVVYDTTDPYTLREVSNTVYSAENQTLTFQITLPSGIAARFFASTMSRFGAVKGITAKSRTNLRNPSTQADYILITHPDFADQAARLASWRGKDSSTDPLIPIVVPIDDVFDEFSWGIYDPVAIRVFLHYAMNTYNNGLRPVRYCCLFGDTTFKYKNISQQQDRNYIPTFTSILSSDGLASDDFFTWFNASTTPALAIGRLCANSVEEANTLVDKIIAYETNANQGRWQARALLIADDEYITSGNTETSPFTAGVEDLDNGYSGNSLLLPPKIERIKLLMIEYPLVNFKKPAVTDELFRIVNDGCLIMNYIGHGNNDVLAHENILRGSRDAGKFTNGDKLPLFLTFSCTVGQFDKPGITSLAETMNLIRQGGSVAAISPARFTFSYDNAALVPRIYKHLFDSGTNPEYRMGLALSRAKADVNTRNSHKFIFFGDPATRLMIPRDTITVEAPDSLAKLQTVTIDGSLDGVSKPAQQGKLIVEAFGPKLHKVYQTNKVSIAYTKPGRVIFRGVHDLETKDFQTSFIVPLDSETDTDTGSPRESIIRFFALGSSYFAVGVADSLSVNGVASGNADNTPPDMTVRFDNKPFEEGGFIRRNPLLTVNFEDASGINTTAQRGHTIQLIIDRQQIIPLTDYYTANDSYTSGTLEYALPELDSGEHHFELTVYDTYNNVAKKTFTATVVGTETGSIAISNLLNYPNPMGSEGTTFTFDLNDYAQSADIRVYTMSGRLVDRIRFSAVYGFNTATWTPPRTLANGVYFYKLSVTSMNGRSSSKIEKLVVMR